MARVFLIRLEQVGLPLRELDVAEGLRERILLPGVDGPKFAHENLQGANVRGQRRNAEDKV